MGLDESKFVGRIIENKNGGTSHSYRDWSLAYLKRQAKKAETRDEKARVRRTWNYIEQGRLADAVDAVHALVYYMDKDERRSFFSSNKRMKSWVNLHGMITGKKQF